MGAYIQQAGCDYLALKLFYNEIGATDFNINDRDIVTFSIEGNDSQSGEIDIDLTKRTIEYIKYDFSLKKTKWDQKICKIIKDYDNCNDLFEALWRIYYRIDAYKAKNYCEILSNFRANELTFNVKNLICLTEIPDFISFAKTLNEVKFDGQKLNNRIVIKDNKLYTQIKNELILYDKDSPIFKTLPSSFNKILNLMFELKKLFSQQHTSTLISRAFEKICTSYNIHFNII